eukprot:CCRYP_002264-RA/>CCRYP_002264-RA protein AED:0.21 eAED:0.21 QI:459/-1/1/1/-1/1/1/144/191
MKLGASLSLALLLQAAKLASAFRAPCAKNVIRTIQTNDEDVSKSRNALARHASTAIVGGLAASLFPHPKMAHAIGFRSRVPLPTAPGGVDPTNINRHVSQTAVLVVWALFMMAALEWNGFGYFRHLSCRIRNLGREEDDLDVGLAKESDWDSYSHLLDPFQNKKKMSFGTRVKNWFRRSNRSKSTFDYDVH